MLTYLFNAALRLKHVPRAVSYTHLDVYKRQGTWDIQFNAGFKRHHWGGVIFLSGVPLSCKGEFINQTVESKSDGPTGNQPTPIALQG